jgi:hypothetical protein
MLVLSKVFNFTATKYDEVFTSPNMEIFIFSRYEFTFMTVIKLTKSFRPENKLLVWISRHTFSWKKELLKF